MLTSVLGTFSKFLEGHTVYIYFKWGRGGRLLATLALSWAMPPHLSMTSLCLKEIPGWCPSIQNSAGT